MNGKIALEEHGIEVMLLSLNAPAVQGVPDAAKSAELAQRANDFLAEQVAKRPDRFRGFAALPLRDPELAAAEPLDALTGVWSLEGIDELDSDGSVLAEPYGENPVGQLIYTADGFMTVVIEGHDDSPAVAYGGEVRLEGGGLVRHAVRVGVPPFTEDQIRHLRLEGDHKLVLATDEPGHRRVELRWSRIEGEKD